MFPISSFSNWCSQACSLIKISVAPCDASTPRSTRSIILSKFGHTSDTIRSILRPSLARGKQGAVKRRGGRRHWRRYFRGGSGEKTVSKARIVSPFPEERCTVHLKTSRLSVTARPRQFFIRYTQNASYLSSVSISSSVSLFRGD